MIVKLSLGLSWFPLPPDNVLPVQGVTSLAKCHMTALIRGLKARHRPGRAGGNPRVIGPSDCIKRRRGTSPGSPPSAAARQPRVARSVPAALSSIDSSGPPAMAEVRVLGMFFPQHAGAERGASPLEAACSEAAAARGRESRISVGRRDPKFCPGSRRHQGVSLHGTSMGSTSVGDREFSPFTHVKVARGRWMRTALQQERVSDCVSRGISGRQEQVHFGAKGGVLLPSPPCTYDRYCTAVGSSGPSTLKKSKKKYLQSRAATELCCRKDYYPIFMSV